MASPLGNCDKRTAIISPQKNDERQSPRGRSVRHRLRTMALRFAAPRTKEISHVQTHATLSYWAGSRSSDRLAGHGTGSDGVGVYVPGATEIRRGADRRFVRF